MTSAFCPGHITSFFSPGRKVGPFLSRGSTGAGIRISAGATVEMHETSGSTRIFIDGVESEAQVTREVLGILLPDRAVEVHVEDGLPLSQGFGMSAAGAIAAAFCAAEIAGLTERDAWEAAHTADILGGGGLGDVSAISCLADVPVRRTEGLPPAGEVVGSGLSFPRLSVAVLGAKMYTGNVLSDDVRRSRIAEEGRIAMASFDGSVESFFEASNRFSSTAGVESPELSTVISALRTRGYHAAMCMLGNSVFTDAPQDVLEDVSGCAESREVRSTGEAPGILEK